MTCMAPCKQYEDILCFVFFCCVESMATIFRGIVCGPETPEPLCETVNVNRASIGVEASSKWVKHPFKWIRSLQRSLVFKVLGFFLMFCFFPHVLPSESTPPDGTTTFNWGFICYYFGVDLLRMIKSLGA